MESYFLEYLLNHLDENARRQVDAYLAEHPEAREKLARLQKALDPLALDAELPEPPELLVERTLARIAEHVCAPKVSADLPQAPPVASEAVTIGRSWWRRADVLVAACLLITVTGIGLIILGRLRGPSSAVMIAECKNNLRQFYLALQQYRDQRGEFPDVGKEAPRDVAGMVVPMLSDAGTLPSSVSIRCAGIGGPTTCQVTLTALKTMSDTEFAGCSPGLSMCYAYSLGYKDENGVYHGPPSTRNTSLSQMPILADRPPAEGLRLNSINHGGNGQNVLFADGHVVFMTTRTLGSGDDIFVNRDGRVAAGVDASDIVLGYSAARTRETP